MPCSGCVGMLNSSVVLHWVLQIKWPILRAIHHLGHCPGSGLAVHPCGSTQSRERVALGHPVPPSNCEGKDIVVSVGPGDTVMEG